MSNKTVFISGSSRGIGRATAQWFAQCGWDVIAHAREETEDFKSFVKDLSKEYEINVTPIYFDMRDEGQMKEQIQAIISKPKITIDALINNAGVCDIKLFMMTSIAAIRELYEINLFSHMRLTQLILKRMPEGSSIVNVASIDGISPNKGESAYATSKAALIAWTKVLSQELSGRIRVNAIAPSAVDTDMAHGIEKQANWDKDALLKPSDVAKAIYNLSSEDALETTGTVQKIVETNN